MPKNGQTKDVASGVTGPRSLTRLLGLFDVLAKSKHGMSLAELNQALQSPKSSLLNLLRPLVIDGYLALRQRTLSPRPVDLPARRQHHVGVELLEHDAAVPRGTCRSDPRSPCTSACSIPSAA